MKSSLTSKDWQTISFWKRKTNAVWYAVTMAVILIETEKLIPSIASYQQAPTPNTATITQALCLSWLHTAAKGRIPAPSNFFLLLPCVGIYICAAAWWIIHGYIPGRKAGQGHMMWLLIEEVNNPGMKGSMWKAAEIINTYWSPGWAYCLMIIS